MGSRTGLSWTPEVQVYLWRVGSGSGRGPPYRCDSGGKQESVLGHLSCLRHTGNGSPNTSTLPTVSPGLREPNGLGEVSSGSTSGKGFS